MSFRRYSSSSGSYSYRRSFRSSSRSSFSGSSGALNKYYNSLLSDDYRPRFHEGLPRPSLDEIWIKYRKYAPDDDSLLDDARDLIKLELNQSQNQRDHHTSEYINDIRQLVVRRGQAFDLDIKLSGCQFNSATDRLQLLFAAGEAPLESKGTLANVHVQKREGDCRVGNDKWKGFIVSSSSSTIKVRVTSPVEAIVSAYRVTVKLYVKEDGDERQFINNIREEIYVIFNPWNNDDQVYMANAKERDEYVMNDTGRVYMGTAVNPHGRPWAFGQFEKCCFEAAFYLLNRSYLNKQSHGNATLIARALSAMANSNDSDGGVLTGKWSGSYAGGTAPTEWNGSIAILEEYMLTKRAVKYGQCWVYSGLLTTLCRAVGIPARSVTNFSSAHDTDASMTIDEHYNLDGIPLERLNRDSVWNFHVWNEGWFRRPDLPPGNDGWQAFDATPQELSENMMRCGPAPVVALKQGNVYLGYDAKFIFAEVNGDKVVWMVKPSGDMYPVKELCQPRSVGKSISTKAVGSSERNDITNLYKYPEGSEEERESVYRACEYSSKKTDLDMLYDENEVKDVTFQCQGNCYTNGDVELIFGARNGNLSEHRTIQFKLRAVAVYYTGVVGDHLISKEDTMTLEPEEGKEAGWRLPTQSYINMIADDATIKIYVTAKVKETEQFFAKDEIYQIDKPDIELELSDDRVTVGGKVDVIMTFTNPIDAKLTDGVFRVEGPGIQKHLKIPVHKGIAPGQQVTERVTLTPQQAGKRELIASFNCRQLTNITGVITMQVAE